MANKETFLNIFKPENAFACMFNFDDFFWNYYELHDIHMMVKFGQSTK